MRIRTRPSTRTMQTATPKVTQFIPGFTVTFQTNLAPLLCPTRFQDDCSLRLLNFLLDENKDGKQQLVM